jgi:hypothetical protein
MLMLLSGIAIGLMFLVNGEGKVGGNDLESSQAFYGAESGMEKLSADVAALYQTKVSPTQNDFNLVAANVPTSSMIPGMNYTETIAPTSVDTAGNPVTKWEVISSGNNAGLTAEIIPLTLQVTANRLGGASAKMSRNVEVALIPVFQFGVFSDSDLSYFAGPQFAFQGRVHTNGNLFLAADPGPLILDAKVTAVGEIVRDRLANNWTGGGYQGNVYVPTASGGCDPPGLQTNTYCKSFTIPSASCSGGLPPLTPLGACSANGGWVNTSTVSFNGFIGNNTSLAVKPLVLPFVTGNAAQQIQIIRKPPAGEVASSPLGTSREYNKAQIRVLLADTQLDLHQERGLIGDGQDVDLTAGGVGLSVLNVSGTPAGSTSFFAVADTTVAKKDPNMIVPRGSGLTKWPLITGWLRVEYLDKTTGNWVGCTNEWLQLGFSKNPYVARTSPGVDATAHPNAILIFQQLADRDGNGVIANGNVTVGASTTTESPTVTGSSFNFYPINFYDPREGFPRDATTLAGTQGYANGIMNAVELDVGNLRNWLLGNIGANGGNVNFANQNGYILFYSDRRGELIPTGAAPAVTDGEYGFEDVINSASATGTPDGALDPIGPSGFSPEDVDENGVLDKWGAANVGDGFGQNTALPAGAPSPYVVVDMMNGGRQNWVSGARHVLRLVDGGYSGGNSNVPIRPDGANPPGGFTIASENPVYVLGDYNSYAGDAFWGNINATDPAHPAAAIIADAVTLLSDAWSDLNDNKNTLTETNRNAATTYYRMAIAAGKNMNFLQPAGTGKDFGTDGGVHNFLRYIEDWGGATLNYRGSIVSLYYSQYATGTFKCCTLVYNPPTRNYYFDTAFLNPQKLPPGTPMFQDVVNLTYWQDFRPY